MTLIAALDIQALGFQNEGEFFSTFDFWTVTKRTDIFGAHFYNLELKPDFLIQVKTRDQFYKAEVAKNSATTKEAF